MISSQAEAFIDGRKRILLRMRIRNTAKTQKQIVTVHIEGLWFLLSGRSTYSWKKNNFIENEDKKYCTAREKNIN